jgi:hypothetical protein
VKFLVDARLVPGADIAPYLAAEQRRIRELHDAGFIELLYRRVDGTGAWLIVTERDPQSAHRQLNTLPFVEVGIMTMHLSEIDPVDIATL